MKKRLRKFGAYPFYRKFFFVYILSVVLFTVIVFGSLLGVVTHYFSVNSTQSAEKILNQLVVVSEYLKNDVDNLSSMVATHGDTISFMGSDQENKLTNYHLYQELNNYKANYPYVVDISVVNLEHKTSVQSSGTNVNDRINVALAESFSQQENQILRRTIQFYDPDQNYQVVSFLYQLPAWKCAIIVDVNVDRFSLSIGNEEENSHRVAVVDCDGNWIEYPDSFPLPELDQEQVKRILQEHETLGSFFTHEDPELQLTLYFAKSESLDWWFIDAQRYPQFLTTYGTLGIVFSAIMLLFLTVCTVMSLIFSRQIQKPLVHLVERLGDSSPSEEKFNEIQYLERFLNQMEHERYLNEKHLDSLYLSSVLFGRDMPFSISEKSYGALRQKYASPYYSVLLLKFWPEYEIREEEREQEFNLIQYTIGNLAEEIFSKYFQCYASDLKEDYLALLLLFPTTLREENCRECFETLKGCALEHLHIQLSACMGPVVDQFDDIGQSCEKAQDCLHMENFIKKGDFLNTENINPPSYQEKNKSLVQLVEQYTVENYGDPDLSLKRISKEVGLSTVYLGKVFKSVKGVSYHTFVTTVRLEQAKKALLETNKTVVEISAQVGFSSATYFATVFKNTFGMTPSAYRGTAKSPGRPKE